MDAVAAPVPDAVLELIPGGAGATGFTAAKRTYDQQVAKINEFFEQARQYQKEMNAKAPGFKRDLKMDATWCRYSKARFHLLFPPAAPA